MKVQNKKTRKYYSHKDITGMLRDPARRSGPFSYLHPQISPTGQSFTEDDDTIAMVADAKKRYIKNGWMPNRRVSESASTKRDITALMSLEGTLTASVHNAIQGYDMFDTDKGREALEKMRRIDVPPVARPIDDDEKAQEVEQQHAHEARASALDTGLASAGLTKMAHKNLTSTESEIHLAAHQTGVAREAAESVLPPGVSGIVGDLATIEPPDPEFPEDSPPPHPKKPINRGQQTGGKATSAKEYTEAVQEEVKSQAPPKKKRNTKKKRYRETLDGKGIRWRKSWSTKRLLAEIEKNSTDTI